MLMAVNMPGAGERFVFAQCLLHLLMRAHNVWPYGSFYDINCRFGPHFRNVSAACGASGLWSPPLAAWGSELLTPLPPFHRYMHTAECAEKHTLELHAPLGMGSGEPTETANGYLGIQGGVLQYCRKPVRVIWLEAQILGWQCKKADDLPSLLLRTWHKACLTEQLYMKEQLRLALKAVKDCGVPSDQVCVAAYQACVRDKGYKGCHTLMSVSMKVDVLGCTAVATSPVPPPPAYELLCVMSQHMNAGQGTTPAHMCNLKQQDVQCTYQGTACPPAWVGRTT